MAADLTERVRELADAREVSEAEILEQALERGVEDLWTDHVLSQYLNEDLSRADAIELVGRDRIERAEREMEAVEDDVHWGLNP
jgi:predicted transcriptional regulator